MSLNTIFMGLEIELDFYAIGKYCCYFCLYKTEYELQKTEREKK